MSAVKRLGAQIFVYGLATVLPRALSFLLLPLYTSVFKEASGYGEYIFIYSWIALFNVLLTYGMETSFFMVFSIFCDIIMDILLLGLYTKFSCSLIK